MKLNEILKSLPKDKIKINWNKNPIEVDLLCSFLPNIELTISRDHLGSSNGWTERHNKSLNLIIGGGIVNGKNYLNTIQYGTKMQNPYNNYVNPFALLDIMNEDGKKFFIGYYSEELNAIISKSKESIKYAEKAIEDKKQTINELKHFIS